MQPNALYNLLCQLVQEQKSLWRITNHYIEESANPDERSYWEAMANEKEELIADLMELIKPYFS